MTAPPVVTTSDVVTTPGWRMFQALFADADKAGLPLIPLRPRPRDAETALSGGDYDLLMPLDGFPLLVSVLWQRALNERASFSINHVNPHKLQVFLHLPEVGRNILLEIWTRLEVRDPARQSARYIPWSAVAPLIVRTPDGPRLPPAVEIAYYLSHLSSRTKQVEQPLVAQRLATYGVLAREQAPELAPLLDGLTNEHIRDVAIAANTHLRSIRVLESRGAIAAFGDSLRARIDSILRQRRRRRLQRARIIAMTGPDGSGKSTLITRWCESVGSALRSQRFKNLFRHHPRYQLFRFFNASATRKQLGGTMPTNLFDEVHAGTMFHIARATWPWFRLLVAARGRRCLDRGFPDLLFNGLRGTGPQPALRDDWAQFARRMPLPDWHIHLDAPDEVIRGRKQELSVASLQCYRDGMGKIIGAAPANGISRLDTSGPVDAVAACLRLAADSLGVRLPWKKSP